MKKYIILALIALLAAGGVAGWKYWQYRQEDAFLSSNPQTKDAYALVKKRKADIKADKNNYDAYMSLGFSWKGIGEVTKNNQYLERAIDAYSAVIKKWGMQAYLPFLNRANTYILLGQYDKAENDLKIASEIDPGEQDLYVNLANLYKDYMEKTDEEIRAVYDAGLNRVIGGGNLVLNYASYLYDAGDWAESLKYYKMLAQAYPNNTSYADIINELQAKVAEAK